MFNRINTYFEFLLAHEIYRSIEFQGGNLSLYAIS
jgi:hypothetical protein